MGRRGKRLIGALAVAGVAGALALLPRNQSLIERAVRVPGSCEAAYVWQSDRSLIQFPAAIRAIKIDVTTGAETALTAFDTRFRADKTYDLILGAASPDGRWLGYVPQNSNNYWSSLCIAELDGAQCHEWPQHVPDEAGNGHSIARPIIVWLPDSRRWLELTERPNQAGKGLALHSLDTPDAGAVWLDAPKGASYLAGVTADYRAIFTDIIPRLGATRHVTFYEVGLYPNLQTPRQFGVWLPPDAEVVDIQLSPQGDRLAWTLHLAHPPTFRKFLSRFIPAFRKNLEPLKEVGLYVSRLEASELRQIGFQKFASPSSAQLPLSEVRWLPDGKRLSFLHEGALYTLPVD